MNTTTTDTKVSAAIREMMAHRTKAKEAPKQEAAPVPEVRIEKKPVVIGEGYKSSTDLGCTDMFAVRVFADTDWDEDVRFLIPDVDPMFKAPAAELSMLLRAWEMGDKVMIYGPTGSGKSSLVKHACALTRRPFLRINLTRDTDSGQLFGERGIEDGRDVFRFGPLTEAVRKGMVFLLDEWTLMQAEISMGMQNLMEENGWLYLKEMPGKSEDKQIIPHEHFRLVACDNTNGQGDETGAFAGTSVQNSATIDRFGTAFKLGYLPAKDEIAMLQDRYPSINATVLKSFRNVADQIRKSYEQGNISLTLSPRGLINLVRKYEATGDVRLAFDVAYCNKLRESDARVVAALVDKVFPR